MATTGQATVLQTHYASIRGGPVAYLDETYHLQNDGRTRFYVIAAVVVVGLDRDPLRDELDRLVPSGWWHTTDELRSTTGRELSRDLLRTLRVPDEACVIVEKTTVDAEDKDGSLAWEAALRRLLAALNTGTSGTHSPVNLAILEEQREARKNNFDRSVRARLIRDGLITARMSMISVSPRVEHLLWLPDLVCSAYRQLSVHRRSDLFDEIEELAHVIRLP